MSVEKKEKMVDPQRSSSLQTEAESFLSNREVFESEEEQSSEIASSEQHSAIELRTDSSISDSENERQEEDEEEEEQEDEEVEDDDDTEDGVSVVDSGSEASESEHRTRDDDVDGLEKPSRKRSRSSRNETHTETYRLGGIRRQSNSSVGEEEEADEKFDSLIPPSEVSISPSSSSSVSPLSSPPAQGNGETVPKKRGRPKKIKRGRPPSYIYINPHPQFVWVHVNTAVPVTTPGAYANALYNSLNTPVKQRTKKGFDPSILKPLTSTSSRYADYYTENIATRTTRRWNQETNLKYTSHSEIPIGSGHQAIIPEYQSKDAVKALGLVDKRKSEVDPITSHKTTPSESQRVVQLTDLISEDTEKDEKDEKDELSVQDDDSVLSEDFERDRWFGELEWDQSRLPAEEVLRYLNEIKELVSMDLAEYDPVKANKILECADSKFGRWAFSEEKALIYLSTFDYDVAMALNAIKEESQQNDYKRAQMRRSKIGIVVGSVSSRFMEAIPTDPDINTTEDDFCYYCGKDCDTLVICSGAHCGRVFHLECLREKTTPEGDWKCPVCIGQKFMSLTAFSLGDLSDVPRGLKVLHHVEDPSYCKNERLRCLIEKLQKEQLLASSNKSQSETMNGHQDIHVYETTITTRSYDCVTSLTNAQKLEEIEIKDESVK